MIVRDKGQNAGRHSTPLGDTKIITCFHHEKCLSTRFNYSVVHSVIKWFNKTLPVSICCFSDFNISNMLKYEF